MTVPTVRVASDTYGFLATPSELYEEMLDIWVTNEARFEGGHRVQDELWRFDWETQRGGLGFPRRDGVAVPLAPATSDQIYLQHEGPLEAGEHYERRQGSLIYTNFMESLAIDTVGALLKHAPSPVDGLDFGTLGKVRRRKDITDTPSRAELSYYNINGVGIDGSQWDNFWAAQMKLAMVTGYRLIMVEAPSSPGIPVTRAREQQGFRPWLVGLSPRNATNFHYDRGRLSWIIFKTSVRHPRVVNGRFEGNRAEDEYLLMVRRGVMDLGAEFVGGGWFRFDKERLPIPGQRGTWDKTGGDIPVVPLFYDKHPTMFGRPALTELGNAGIAAMNIHSAADFDAFDSAGSVKAVVGADEAGFNLFIKKINGGNRYSPLAVNRDTQRPATLEDATGGQIAADVFEKRLTAILRAVDRIIGSELKSAAPNSGLAQQAGYALASVPRLAIMAGNMEEAQNAILTFLEMRWGETSPSASTKWTRKFELIQLTSTAQAVLQLMQIAGLHSVTLESDIIVSAARSESFITDNAKAQEIEDQLKASAVIRDQAAALAAQPKPQTPGARSTPTPPEPAQTNQEVKTQMDGPSVE